MNLPPSQPDDFELPLELRDIAAGADRLGQAERASAPSGLEARMLRASLGSLPSSAVLGRVHAPSERGVARAIHARVARRMRLAAAIMLVAGVSIAVLGIWGVKWGGGMPAGGSRDSIASGRAEAAPEVASSANSAPASASPEIDAMLASIEAVDALVPELDSGALASDSDWDSSALHDVLSTSFTSEDATQ